MSIALKPDVSTLQIVEVDVSTSQKMGKPSCMSAGYSVEQKVVTNCMNGLSRKLKVMRQPGNLRKTNVSSVEKVMVRKCLYSIHFCDTILMSSCHTPNLAADIGFDNPLTPT